MGVYNCNKPNELKRSVKSIIDQEYGDWELIICDDGSSDNTQEILQDIHKMDSRIRIVGYKNNCGLAYALNQCIQVSKGEYIARQDADDISKPDRLMKQVKYLNENKNVSIVGCIADVFDDSGIWGEFLIPENPTVNDFLWNCPFLHPTVLMRADDLKKVDCYRISKETMRCEDYDLFMRMYANSMVGHNIQEKLFQYNIEVGNKKYRPMNVRLEETAVRFYGFRQLKLLPSGIPYILKPIIIGLIPQFIFKLIRRKQYNTNDNRKVMGDLNND